jgi:hypothetical protein
MLAMAKHEIAKQTRATKVYRIESTRSKRLPIHGSKRPLARVADAYIRPKVDWLKESASRNLGANTEMKKVCPNPEKKQRIKPAIKIRL